jgi:anti-sigma factor RsiW
MRPCPDKHLLLHALADGEIDAANTLALEDHLAGCDGCRSEYARILELRALLQPDALAYAPPAGLEGTLAAMFAAASDPERRR